MCYSNSSTSSTLQIADRYKKGVGQVDDEPLYIANGFQFPKFRIITQEQNIQQFNWGLIPHWYRGDWKEIATKTLNAKIETLYEKKSFKNLIGRKHCIIPSNGFFEWQTIGKEKTPFFISPSKEEFFSMVGLFDEFLNTKTGEILNTFTLITTEANSLMSEIHNLKKRMPLIIQQEAESDWLNGNIERVIDYKFPSELMQAYPVRKKSVLSNLNAPETQHIYIENKFEQGTLF